MINSFPPAMNIKQESAAEPEVPASSRSEPVVEFWNVILTGILDNGQVCANRMAKVDVVLVQISKPGSIFKVEPGASPSAGISKVLVQKTVDLEIISVPSTPAGLEEDKMIPSVASRCPVIAIPEGGPDVFSLRLTIRVSIFRSTKVEAQSKRQRFTPEEGDIQNLLVDEVEGKTEEPEVFIGSLLLFHQGLSPNVKLKQKDLSIQLKSSPRTSSRLSSSNRTDANVKIALTIQKSKTLLPDFMPPPKHLLPPPPPRASTATRKVRAERKRTDQKVVKTDDDCSKWLESFPCPPPFPVFPADTGLNPNWLRIKAKRTIAEYSDINEGEKKVMAMWNEFVQSNAITGDCQIGWACKRFVELHGADLFTENLRTNFTLHLINLFEFGLLTSEEIRNVIVQLDSSQKPTEEDASVQDSAELLGQLRVENDEDED